jgi:hypothetical protein
MEAKMAEKKSSPYIMKQRIVLPLKKKQALISLPTSWPSFRYEYNSPVIWLPWGPSVWTFDFSFANRGVVDGLWYILLTEFHYAIDQPVKSIGPLPSLAGRIFLLNEAIEFLDSPEGSGWWARMFVTSRDVIPSLHVYANTPQPDSNPPYYPDFYFSPGDFAFFEMPGTYFPPGLGPVNQP